jgi:transposase
MYIGLDVHSKQTTYVAQDAAGRVLGAGETPTGPAGLEAMILRLGAPPGTAVGLESGTQAFWVSRLLAARGLSPVVVSAQEVRAKARRVGQKTDRRDAFEICDGVRRDIYTSVVYVPPAEVERLRQLLSRRRHFVRLGVAQINAAKFLLGSRGLPGLGGRLSIASGWHRLLERPEAEACRSDLARHFTLWQAARAQVAEIEAELVPASEPFAEVLERLRAVPGVGPVTATTFVAVLGTPERFARSGMVVSYLGLAPSMYDSGGRERHGRITKRGSPAMRATLCEAAQHARLPSHPLHRFFRRVCAKGGYKKAVTATARRLARMLFRIWRDGADYDPSRVGGALRPATR